MVFFAASVTLGHALHKEAGEVLVGRREALKQRLEQGPDGIERRRISATSFTGFCHPI